MSENNTFDETPYETDPVESLAEALLAFVEAYDALQMSLGEEFPEFRNELRLTMYKPVCPESEENVPSISLYEIGVVYFPDKAEVGKYAVHANKLEEALMARVGDVRALFVQDDGLLPELCEIIPEFLEEECPQEVHDAAMRFLNECRRLSAMWS